MMLGLVTVTAAVAATPPRADGSIEVAAVWTGVEQERFRAVLDEFTDRTGIDVTYTSTGDDISTGLDARIADGDPPDVAIVPQPGLVQDFARRGSLTPVDDAVGTAVDQNYAPVWRELGTVDGRLYAVWFKGANKSLVWFDRDAYRDAGVRPADSLESLVADLPKLAAGGTAPLAVGGADGWTLTDIFENVYLAQVGPEQYARLARHEIPWTDESVKTALRSMAELVAAKNLVGAPSEALGTDFAESVQQVFGKDPTAASLIEGDFVANVVDGETDARVGVDARVFPFPAVSGGEPPVVAGGDAAILLRDSGPGKRLMRFLATPAAAEAWASKGGFLSPNRNVDRSVYPDPTSRKMARNLVESENLYFDLSDLQPPAFGATEGQGEWKIFQDFLADPSNVDGTAQQLEDAATQARSD